MHINVNLDLCQSHGQCVFAAPDHFWFDSDDNLIFRADLGADPDAEVAVREAAASCPVAAITLREVAAP